jgi:putative SOS response-associated peptidase YedK
MINAHCESLPDKPAFRNAVRFRRCIVPASGYYEWKPEGSRKVPYYTRLSDGAPMGFAGIWEAWKTPEASFMETFAILTSSANPLIAPIHDRMPVILHPDAHELWLNKDMRDPGQLQSLYPPYPADLMTLHPVSNRVRRRRSKTGAYLNAAPSLTPNNFRMIASGQNPVKEDCSRLAPTKAVTHSQ